jgi:hypothetical protein
MGNSWVGGQEPGASARGAGPRMEAPPRAEGPGRAGAGPGRGRHRRARRGRPRRGRGRRRGRGVGDRAGGVAGAAGEAWATAPRRSDHQGDRWRIAGGIEGRPPTTRPREAGRPAADARPTRRHRQDATERPRLLVPRPRCGPGRAGARARLLVPGPRCGRARADVGCATCPGTPGCRTEWRRRPSSDQVPGAPLVRRRRRCSARQAIRRARAVATRGSGISSFRPTSLFHVKHPHGPRPGR